MANEIEKICIDGEIAKDSSTIVDMICHSIKIPREVLPDSESIDYFDICIEDDLKRIDKYNHWLDNGEVKEDRILPVKDGRARMKFDILVSKYSRGDEVSFLVAGFLDFLDDFFKLDNERFFSYRRNLVTISFAMLLELPESILSRIESRIYEKDGLIEFIASKGVKKELVELAYPEGWQLIFDVLFIKDKNKQEEQLKYFIEKWAKINEEEGAFESYKNMNVNSYHGYWCFEAGAVAKILEVTDNELKENQYYPYDMVHFIG